MTGGHYADVSTVLANSSIRASVLKTAIETLDQTIYDLIGGGTGSVDINGGTIDNAVIGASVPKAATLTDLALLPTASVTMTRYAANPQMLLRQALGSAASPAAITNNSILARFAGAGYQTTSSPGFTGSLGEIRVVANQDFTNTAQGTKLEFWTTPDAAAADVLALTLTGGGSLQLKDGGNLQGGSSSGMKIGTATTQKLGFWNATPVVQPSAYTQTYATASKTQSALTASAPPAGGTGATAGAYDTAAHRDALITSVTALLADVTNIKQVLNSVIDDLQAIGLLS